MSGKKGSGLGNLNAVKHSEEVFWRRRMLSPANRWILPLLRDYKAGLSEDKPQASAGELRMMDLCTIAHGCSMLILAEAARSGFVCQVDGTWDLSPGAAQLGKFLSVEQRALLGLGLERRAKKPLTLTEYLNGAPVTSEPAATPANTKGAKA